MRHDPLASSTATTGRPAIRTFADLLAVLPTLGYTPRTAAQIRPQILRSAEVCRQPLARIAADAGAFEARWGRGRDTGGAIAAGFRDQAQFLEWRRRVRAALERAARPAGAHPVAAPLLPGWMELVDFCRENQAGNARRVPPHLHVSLRALGIRASARGIDLPALTEGAVTALFAGVKGSERRTLRCGLRSLGRLAALRAALPEIAAVLPVEAPALPAALKRAAAGLGRDVPSLAPLWSELDALLAGKSAGPAQGALAGAAAGLGGEPMRKAYEGAVRSALALLHRRGALRAAPRLADLLSLEALQTIEEEWRDRIARGEVRGDAITLRMLLERLVHLALLCGPKKKEAKRLRSFLHHHRARLPSSASMSPAHLEWIKRYAASPAQQRAVHGMPERLMREAEAVLRRWDAGEPVAARARMRALALGTAAAMAAILFRASPVRAGNLHALRHQGADAELVLVPGRLRLDIAGHRVKNRRSIETDADADCLPILAWYLERIRPRLIAEHPYGKGATDSDYLFPGRGLDAPLDRTTLEKRYAEGVAAAGLDLTLHQARHICAFHVLDQDPNAWAEAAEVLGDTVETVRRYYAWLDARKVGRRGREHLLAARRQAGRKVKRQGSEAQGHA